MKNKAEFHEYPENSESIKLKIHELLEELSITEDLKKRISIMGLVGVYQRSLMLLKEAESSLNEVLDLISKNNLWINLSCELLWLF